MNLTSKAKQHLSWSLLILLGLGVFYFLICSEGGYLALRERRQTLHNLMLEREELKREKDAHWQEIDGLKNSPGEMERLVRESDYARPDEIIVTVPKEEKD